MLEKERTFTQQKAVKNKIPPVTSHTDRTAADSGPPHTRKVENPAKTLNHLYEDKKPSREEQELNALVHELKETMNKPLSSPDVYVSLKKKLLRLRNFLEAHPDLCKELNQRNAQNSAGMTNTVSAESILHADLQQMENNARLPERRAALLSPQGQEDRMLWMNELEKEMQGMQDPGLHADEWKAMKAALAYAKEVNIAAGRELQNGRDPDGKPRVSFEYLQKLDGAMETLHLSALVYRKSLERSMKAHHKVNPARLRLAGSLEDRSIGELKRTRTAVRRTFRRDSGALLEKKAMKKQLSEVSAVLESLSHSDRFAKEDSAEYREMVTALKKLQNMQKKLEQKTTAGLSSVQVTPEEFNACYGEKGTAVHALAAVKQYIRKNELKENPGRAAAVRMSAAVQMKRYLQTVAGAKNRQKLLEEQKKSPALQVPEMDAMQRSIRKENRVLMM